MTRPILSTGADVIVAGLRRAGVDCIFGLPGTQNLQLYDAIRRSGIRSVVASDEMAATFMACGYARASGRLAVVTTIPGPGFTYALTGLAEAHADSAPLLLVTLRQRDLGHSFQLQQLDVPALARPVVKQVFTALALPELLPQLAAAVDCALRGEPGPVVLEIAAPILGEDARQLSNARLPMPAANAGALPDAVPGAEALPRLLQAVSEARFPLVFAGYGAQGCAAELREWCERYGIPCVTTCSGRGVLPESHPLALSKDLAWGLGDVLPDIIERADLVLALGCKFAHNGCAGFKLRLPTAKLARVDTGSPVLAGNYPARHVLTARCEDVVAALRSGKPRERSGWTVQMLRTFRARLAEERDTPVADEPRLHGTGEHVGAFLTRLQQALPDDRILTTDSGQNQALTRKYARVDRARGIIAPTDFQSMGFGLPAAIGVKIAQPNAAVLACIGDGGLLQTASELFTAVREGLDMTVLVFNDGKFGYIERQQIASYGAASGVLLGQVDLESLAAAYGCTYIDASATGEALAERLRVPGVKLLELRLHDAPSMRLTRIKARARTAASRATGPRVKRLLRALLGR